MNRNHSIDVIKFVFSIVILLHHFNLLFFSGYLAVEGFFMISGFLMMNSLFAQTQETILKENSSARFVFKKYSAIFLPLLFSAISGFLIYELLVITDATEPIIQRIPYLLFEIFPLQVVGFEAYYATGVSWYLSALFLGIAIIHPLAKRNPERFAYTVCPPVILLFYGFLCFKLKNLNVPCVWLLDFINSGLIRGIAGLCAGCLLFVLSKNSNKAKKITLIPRILYSVLALAVWFFFFQSITNKDLIQTTHDFITTAALFGALYLELSQKTILSLIFRHRWTSILSTVSTYVFMNHYAWAQYFLTLYPNSTWQEVLPWYLLCTAVSSCAVALLTFIVRFTAKKLKSIPVNRSLEKI